MESHCRYREARILGKININISHHIKFFYKVVADDDCMKLKTHRHHQMLTVFHGDALSGCSEL